MNKYYTVSEAANRLGVNKATVQRWLSDDKIQYIQVGTGWRRIPQSEIDRIMGDCVEPIYACINCGKTYKCSSATIDKYHFCSDRCREEYNNYLVTND